MSVNGKQACSSNAVYGSTGPKKEDHKHGNMAVVEEPKDNPVWETITKMTKCNELIDVKKGDTGIIQANYDLEKHPP